eukprot:scaffold76257_cov17-Tisochrysis_lutea.AAC.2
MPQRIYGRVDAGNRRARVEGRMGSVCWRSHLIGTLWSIGECSGTATDARAKRKDTKNWRKASGEKEIKKERGQVPPFPEGQLPLTTFGPHQICKLNICCCRSLGVQVPGRPATIDYIWATSDLDLVAIYNPLKGQGQKLATSC